MNEITCSLVTRMSFIFAMSLCLAHMWSYINQWLLNSDQTPELLQAELTFWHDLILLDYLFCRLKNLGKGMLQPHQIIAEYNSAIPEAEREKLKDGAFEDVLRAAQVCIIFRSHQTALFLFGVCSSSDHLCCVILQEAIVIPPWVALAIRPRPGVWEYVRVNVSELAVEELRVPEYLQFKEQLVEEGYKFAPKLIMIDF